MKNCAVFFLAVFFMVATSACSTDKGTASRASKENGGSGSLEDGEHVTTSEYSSTVDPAALSKITLSEELVNEELTRALAQAEVVDATASDQTPEVAPKKATNLDEAKASAKLEIEKIFALKAAEHPETMTQEDAANLSIKLNLFIDASISKNTFKATKYWNDFARCLIDIHSRQSSELHLRSVITVLVDSINNLIKIAFQLVGAILTLDIAGVLKLVGELVELIFAMLN